MEQTKADNTTPNGEKAEDFVSLLLAWYSRQKKSAEKDIK